MIETTPENNNSQEKVKKTPENSDTDKKLKDLNGKEIQKAIDPDIIMPEDFVKEKLDIKKTKIVSDKKESKNIEFPSIPYVKPILTIRGMESNESDIPLKNKQQIIDAINSLGEFEKINIKGCTDGSQINTEDSQKFNKNKFDEVRNKYIEIGGTSPTYDQLMESKQDPQNTILGYRRAMEGIISLNLSPEQMKKVSISNVLGKSENNSQERGFDIEADYSQKVEHVVESETTDFLYKFLGALDLNSLGRYEYNDNGNKNYGYHMTNLNLKTHFDPDNPTALYTRIAGNIPPTLAGDTVMQEKIQNQVKSYLRGLIYACGGEYNNGTWTAKALSRKQYYTIAAVHDNLISNNEFKSLLEKDVSVLENKKLTSGQTIKELLEENKNNPITGVGHWSPTYTYYVEDGNKKSPLERRISKNDYILLGLYFQTKNS